MSIILVLSTFLSPDTDDGVIHSMVPSTKSTVSTICRNHTVKPPQPPPLYRQHLSMILYFYFQSKSLYLTPLVSDHASLHFGWLLTQLTELCWPTTQRSWIQILLKLRKKVWASFTNCVGGEGGEPSNPCTYLSQFLTLPSLFVLFLLFPISTSSFHFRTPGSCLPI